METEVVVKNVFSPGYWRRCFSRGAKRIDGYSSIGREVLEAKGLVECKESFDISSLATKFPRETPKWKPHAQSLATQSVILAK